MDDLELQPCEIVCKDGTIKIVMAKKIVTKAEDFPMKAENDNDGTIRGHRCKSSDWYDYDYYCPQEVIDEATKPFSNIIDKVSPYNKTDCKLYILSSKFSNYLIDKFNEVGCTSFNFESMSDEDKNAVLEKLSKED